MSCSIAPSRAGGIVWRLLPRDLFAALHAVVSVADQDIFSEAAVDVVHEAVEAGDAIRTGVAPNDIGTLATVDDVIADTAVDLIVVAIAVDHVLAGVAEEMVRASA